MVFFTDTNIYGKYRVMPQRVIMEVDKPQEMQQKGPEQLGISTHVEVPQDSTPQPDGLNDSTLIGSGFVNKKLQLTKKYNQLKSISKDDQKLKKNYLDLRLK